MATTKKYCDSEVPDMFKDIPKPNSEQSVLSKGLDVIEGLTDEGDEDYINDEYEDSPDNIKVSDGGLVSEENEKAMSNTIDSLSDPDIGSKAILQGVIEEAIEMAASLSGDNVTQCIAKLRGALIKLNKEQ